METGARERARNSYIRNHERPSAVGLLAGYELITKAPNPRTAFHAGSARRAATCGYGGRQQAGKGSRQQAGRSITQTAESVAASPETHSRARAQLVGRSLPASVPDAARVARAHRAWTPGSWRWDTSAASLGCGRASRGARIA